VTNLPVREDSASAAVRARRRCLVCGTPAREAGCPRCGGEVPPDWAALARRATAKGVFRRLLAGAGFYLKGYGFLLARRRLWCWVWVPAVVSVALLAATLVGGVWLLHGPIHGLFHQQAWFFEAVEWALEILVAAALVVILVMLFTAVATALGAPFYDALTARVEAEVLGPEEEEPFRLKQFLRDTVLPIWEAAKLLALQLVVMLVLMLLWFVPLVGTLPSVLATCWFAALDHLDFPLERKGYRTGEKLRFVWRHKALCLGFGTLASLGVLVPLVNLLALPAGVVGATLMYLGAEDK